MIPIAGKPRNVAPGRLLPVLGLILAVLGSRGTASGSLINGSFESDFHGWTAAGNVIVGSGSRVTDGNKALAFNSAQTLPNGSVQQTFSTIPGHNYVLSFDVGAVWGPAEQRLQVLVSGASIITSQTFSVLGTGTTVANYVPSSMSFTANSASTTLTFRDASTVHLGVDLLLDNVRLFIAPLVTQQPVSQLAASGSSVTFSVGASGSAPLSYQWRLNGKDIAGATGSRHVIASASTSHSGSYDVVVSNEAGSAVSGSASLTVSASAPEETSPPVSDVLANGSFESGFSPWTSSGNVVLTSRSTDGFTALQFNSGQTIPNGIVSQRFATVPGQSYVLTFDVGACWGSSNVEQLLEVTLMGSGALLSQVVSAFGSGSTAAAYTPASFLFVADSASATLTFRDVSKDHLGIDLLLDNVRVTPRSSTILVNGSFENGYTGWTASGNQVLSSRPSEGTRAVQFNSGMTLPDGVLSQRFATTPGKAYLLTFDAGACWGSSNSEQRLEVSLTGTQVLLSQLVRTFGTGTTEPSYNAIRMQFVADSSSTTLTFRDVSVDHLYVDLLLDNVQVTEDLVYVPSPPAITTQPADATIPVGGGTTFSVVASGEAPLSYQWRFKGANISGATASTYSIVNANAFHAGKYDVVVSNKAGSANSSSASLSVVSSESLLNGSFELGCTAWTMTGNHTMSSRGSDGGKAVQFNTGQTLPDAVVSQTFATIAGQAYVLAFDVSGFWGTSSTQQRLGVNVTGNRTLLSQIVTVSGTGSSDPAYWPVSFTFVADGALTTLTFRDETVNHLDMDMLLDNVRITRQSSVAVRTVSITSPSAGSGLTVAVSPTDNNGLGNGVVTFSRSYNQYSVVNLTAPSTISGKVFQKWQRDGVDFSTSPSTKLTVEGNHTMNAVYVLTAPVITTQPKSTTVTAGGTVSFSVAATGSAPLSYQWRFNGTAISGATGSSHSIANVQSSHGGNYSVLVSNSAGSVTSANALLTVESVTAPVVTQPDSGQITVDLASNLGIIRHVGSGILHSRRSLTVAEPQKTLLEQLKLKFVRQGVNDFLKDYSRNLQLGLTTTVSLPESYGYSRANLAWNGGDLKAYETYVRNSVTLIRDLGLTSKVRYEIWNEPNEPIFWSGTRDQFHAMWKRTVNLIRSIDPKAVIVGPSYSNFYISVFNGFLTFAQAENCLPDVLSWHELNNKTEITDIAANVAALRALLATKGINIKRFEINEMLGYHLQYSSGAAVWEFANLEASPEVEFAGKACWKDMAYSSFDNCYSLTFAGLLTPYTYQPRDIWWTYKRYSEVAGRRLTVIPTGDINGLAGFDSGSATTRILLGNKSIVPATGNTFAVNLNNLSGAGYSSRIRVTIERIPSALPNRYVSGLANPTIVSDQYYTISNNQVKVSLPGFASSDAYMITIRR